MLCRKIPQNACQVCLVGSSNDILYGIVRKLLAIDRINGGVDSSLQFSIIGTISILYGLQGVIDIQRRKCVTETNAIISSSRQFILCRAASKYAGGQLQPG